MDSSGIDASTGRAPGANSFGVHLGRTRSRDRGATSGPSPDGALWRKRGRQLGIGCVWEIAQDVAAKRLFTTERVTRIVGVTLQFKPPGATQWSSHSLAQAQGVSKNTGHRICQDHQLKPHLSKIFKLSGDPKFLEKLTDVVGDYLTPPQNAVVVCVDEKSQIQALQRTQPGLPLKQVRCGTLTHDYERHGTTTLFAALQVIEGKVIDQCYPRHRHQEFLKFLRRLNREFPGTVTLHLILDNYGTHSPERVRRWLAKHPRFILHFIPTSSSWLNLVESWFSQLSQKAVRRGIFRSVADLEQAIKGFLAAWNANPTPFVWTTRVGKILEKVANSSPNPGNPACRRGPPVPWRQTDAITRKKVTRIMGGNPPLFGGIHYLWKCRTAPLFRQLVEFARAELEKNM